MVIPDKLIMEGNWLPIYPHSQLVIGYAGNRKLPVARGKKEGGQVIYRWKPLSHNMDRCTSYLTHHPWSQYFRKNGMNSTARMISMEVHYISFLFIYFILYILFYFLCTSLLVSIWPFFSSSMFFWSLKFNVLCSPFHHKRQYQG